jgi:hypothetical protein
VDGVGRSALVEADGGGGGEGRGLGRSLDQQPQVQWGEAAQLP